MPNQQLARGIWAQFSTQENPFGVTNGMEENLRHLDDHLALYTLLPPQAPGTPLPGNPVDGDGQAYTDGSYATFNGGTWRTYAPRNGVRVVLASGTESWLNTGTGWAQFSVVDTGPAVAAARAEMAPFVEAVVAEADQARVERQAAQAAKDGAEIALNSALIAVGNYVDEPTGRAAVADGVAFKVQGSGDVAAYEYRRVNVSSSVLIASYPSAAAVAANKAKADAAPIITPGKNLLDPSLSSSGFILNSAGTLTAQTGWITTGFIPVTPGAQVSINSQRFCAEYNEAKQFIAGSFFDPGATSAPRTFTLGAGTKFLRVTHASPGSTVQIEYGDASTTFEAYEKLVKAPDGRPLVANNTKNVHPSLVNVVADIANNRQYGEDTYLKQKDSKLETTNLVKSAVSGYIINVDGSIFPSSGWRTTDFIPISELTTYTISPVRFLAFYNSSKVMIGTRVDLNNQSYTVTSPAGAAFMRVTALENANLIANAGSTLAVPVTHIRAFEKTLIPELFAALRGWMRSESFTVTSTITYGSNGRPVSPLNIIWPNGATGALSITYNADGTVSETTATHILDGLTTTVKQPAITYANGVVTQVPAVLIS